MRIITATLCRCLLLVTSVLVVSGCSEQDTEQACFPSLDDQQPQYVIGYGNLLYEATRKLKLEDASRAKVPVIVNGYQRGWIARSKPDGVKSTGLAVTPMDGKRFNGVLLSVSPRTIKGMDRKESGVCRVSVPRKQLLSMTTEPLPEKGQFWIYLVQEKQLNKPAANYPILQSRVDEFLTGCIEQGERFKLAGFSEQCVKETDGWSVHWSNDRARPLGGKPVQTRFREVDRLLEKLEGNLYENIRAH